VLADIVLPSRAPVPQALAVAQLGRRAKMMGLPIQYVGYRRLWCRLLIGSATASMITCDKETVASRICDTA